MLCAIFWGVVGALIAWSFPEPAWAANIREYVITQWNRITKKDQTPSE